MATDVLHAELTHFVANVVKQKNVQRTKPQPHKIPPAPPAHPAASTAISTAIKPPLRSKPVPHPPKPCLVSFSVEVEQHEELAEHKDLHNFDLAIAATATVDELIVRARGELSNKGFSDEFVFRTSLILLSHDGGQIVLLGSRKGKRGTFLRSNAVLSQCLVCLDRNSLFVTIGDPHSVLTSFRDGIAFGKIK